MLFLRRRRASQLEKEKDCVDSQGSRHWDTSFLDLSPRNPKVDAGDIKGIALLVQEKNERKEIGNKDVKSLDTRSPPEGDRLLKLEVF